MCSLATKPTKLSWSRALLSADIVAVFPDTETSIPVVKFKVSAVVSLFDPSSCTISSGVAEALTTEFASITTPDNTRFDPSNTMFLFVLPNSILPSVRSIKAPLSEPVGVF